MHVYVVRCSYGCHMSPACRREIVLPSELMNQHALLDKETYAISKDTLRGDQWVSEMSITLEQRLLTGVTRRVCRCATEVWRKVDKKREKNCGIKKIVEIHDRHYF
jgi:hypothetical protein